MAIRRDSLLVLIMATGAGTLLEVSLPTPARSYVALMAGQRARALNGRFNNVPVLHSNQPEIVTGPGILVDTAKGAAIAGRQRRQSQVYIPKTVATRPTVTGSPS